jgi:hypothetical protein
MTSDLDVVHSICQLLSIAIHVDPSDCIILRTPVGDCRATDPILRQKLTELQRISDRLKPLQLTRARLFM